MSPSVARELGKYHTVNLHINWVHCDLNLSQNSIYYLISFFKMRREFIVVSVKTDQVTFWYTAHLLHSKDTMRNKSCQTFPETFWSPPLFFWKRWWVWPYCHWRINTVTCPHPCWHLPPGFSSGIAAITPGLLKISHRDFHPCRSSLPNIFLNNLVNRVPTRPSGGMYWVRGSGCVYHSW